MDERGAPMLKVPYGQDPYSVIGKYIRDHITAIEDIIAVIEIDDTTINQLFMVDMNEENYFIWNNDWYEGEKDVTLIDFFPVSEAINPSAHPIEASCWGCNCPKMERLNEQKPLQPEPQWIPCSEPPKESGMYIVTAYDGTDKRVTFVKYQKTLKRWDLTGARAYWRILAYKPLPEPWGGEELCTQESKEK